jgi:hypothetical protein
VPPFKRAPRLPCVPCCVSAFHAAAIRLLIFEELHETEAVTSPHSLCDAASQGPRLVWLRRTVMTFDKSVLALPTPRRIRDREHVKSVAKQPCLICDRHPADAHHLRFAQSPALGSKVSDEFTVPLCRGHHREVHRCGDESAWWKKIGIDPTAPARMLWLKSHPLPTSVGQSGSKLQNEPNLETRCP